VHWRTDVLSYPLRGILVRRQVDSSAIDGEHNGDNWGSGGGWNDQTRAIYPDNLQVNLNVMQTIGEIDVYTLKNDFNSGSVVTDSTTFSTYGITNLNVHYWTGSVWTDVPGGAVSGNNLVTRKFIFADITTDKIRVVVNDSADHLFSRVIEIEAFACNPAPPPARKAPPSKGLEVLRARQRRQDYQREQRFHALSIPGECRCVVRRDEINSKLIIGRQTKTV
jgi:hypothetical protein